jgi:hypothetical protein
MGLVRLKTLQQLAAIDKAVHKDQKEDIGEETTEDYPQIIDVVSTDLDVNFDEFNKRVNKLTGQWQMGIDTGEDYGDVTNDGENANLLFAHNPLESDNVMPYEDFHHCTWSDGGSWGLRNPKSVQKFDEPDTVLFKESTQYKDRIIKKFKDFK